MKKTYTQPEVRVTALVSESIIAISGLNAPQKSINKINKTDIAF